MDGDESDGHVSCVEFTWFVPWMTCHVVLVCVRRPENLHFGMAVFAFARCSSLWFSWVYNVAVSVAFVERLLVELRPVMLRIISA